MLEGHLSYVNVVALSPDGKLLASGSVDSIVKLWDAGLGAVLQTLDVDSAIKSLSFPDDGVLLEIYRGLLCTTFLPNIAAVSPPHVPPSVYQGTMGKSRYR